MGQRGARWPQTATTCILCLAFQAVGASRPEARNIFRRACVVDGPSACGGLGWSTAMAWRRICDTEAWCREIFRDPLGRRNAVLAAGDSFGPTPSPRRARWAFLDYGSEDVARGQSRIRTKRNADDARGASESAGIPLPGRHSILLGDSAARPAVLKGFVRYGTRGKRWRQSLRLYSLCM